jgi:hypothetical protein
VRARDRGADFRAVSDMQDVERTILDKALELELIDSIGKRELERLRELLADRSLVEGLERRSIRDRARRNTAAPLRGLPTMRWNRGPASPCGKAGTNGATPGATPCHLSPIVVPLACHSQES